MSDSEDKKRKKDKFIMGKKKLGRKDIIPLWKKLIEIKTSSLLDAEHAFRRGAKYIIDSSLPQKTIYTIFYKIDRYGVEALSPEERQHVFTVQEFYAAHEHLFEQRAEETAHKSKELKYLINIISSLRKKGSPILDAGCGIGRLTLPLLELGYNMQGIDLSGNLIARAKLSSAEYQNRFMQGDLMHTPYPNYNFCAVLMMWHVICEVSRYLNPVFREMYRILVPGGLLIFDLPDKGSDSVRIHYEGKPGQEDYTVLLAKIPEMNTLKQSLERNGFQILNIEHLRWGIHKFVVTARKREF